MIKVETKCWHLGSHESIIPCFLITCYLEQRSWSDVLARSKDESSSQVQDRESRLRHAVQELDETRKALAEARKAADATAADLSDSRARTSELHKLGVDMERELTAMLQGDHSLSFSYFYHGMPCHVLSRHILLYSHLCIAHVHCTKTGCGKKRAAR